MRTGGNQITCCGLCRLLRADAAPGRGQGAAGNALRQGGRSQDDRARYLSVAQRRQGFGRRALGLRRRRGCGRGAGCGCASGGVRRECRAWLEQGLEPVLGLPGGQGHHDSCTQKCGNLPRIDLDGRLAGSGAHRYGPVGQDPGDGRFLWHSARCCLRGRWLALWRRRCRGRCRSLCRRGGRCRCSALGWRGTLRRRCLRRRRLRSRRLSGRRLRGCLLSRRLPSAGLRLRCGRWLLWSWRGLCGWLGRGSGAGLKGARPARDPPFDLRRRSLSGGACLRCRGGRLDGAQSALFAATAACRRWPPCRSKPWSTGNGSGSGSGSGSTQSPCGLGG